jgi:hypothetical protein
MRSKELYTLVLVHEACPLANADGAMGGVFWLSWYAAKAAVQRTLQL